MYAEAASYSCVTPGNDELSLTVCLSIYYFTVRVTGCGQNKYKISRYRFDISYICFFRWTMYCGLFTNITFFFAVKIQNLQMLCTPQASPILAGAPPVGRLSLLDNRVTRPWGCSAPRVFSFPIVCSNVSFSSNPVI